MEDGDPVAEARPEAAERLRRQRDLGHEHDRAPTPLERRRARLEVDLGLAAAGRAREQQVRAAGVEALDDPCHGRLLRRRQQLRLGLAAEALRLRAALSAPRPQLRRDELECPRGRRAVVVRHPEREIDERRRQLVEHTLDRRGLDPGRSLSAVLDDNAPGGTAAEADRDDRALAHPVRDHVGEDARDGRGTRRAGRRTRAARSETRCRAGLRIGSCKVRLTWPVG